MWKKMFIALVAAAIVFALGVQSSFSREQEEATVSATKIINKLDEILANQAEILRQFEAIKQELEIIKIRASR